MRRILSRAPLSQDPREFVLAAILFTLGALLATGFVATTLSGATFSAGDVRAADVAYQLLGWGKYLAALRLAWIGDRAALRRHPLGWRRAALLWLPLLLFVVYGYLQWVVMEGARVHYLQRTGHWDGSARNATLFMAVLYPLAFVAAAANAWWVRRRQLRIAT